MKTKKDLHIPFEWEERRPVFLDRFFYVPKNYPDASQSPFDWADLSVLGPVVRPICMELCSGNGQWIGTRAKARPDCHWVAVEMDFQRARQIWLKADREQIPNLYVICAEAARLLRYYIPRHTVAEVYINFPDPWPKRRHAKHRLIQSPLVESLGVVLVPGGKVTLATDHLPYLEQMKQVFRAAPAWVSSPIGELDREYGDSFFRELWKGKGLSIHYLQYAHG